MWIEPHDVSNATSPSLMYQSIRNVAVLLVVCSTISLQSRADANLKMDAEDKPLEED